MPDTPAALADLVRLLAAFAVDDVLAERAGQQPEELNAKSEQRIPRAPHKVFTGEKRAARNHPSARQRRSG